MNRRLVAVLGVLAFVAVGCGGDDGDAGSTAAERTVQIRMVDTAFEPDTVTAREGETVRFVFENEGKLPHDAFIGDEEAQADHEEEMRAAAGDQHGGHGDEDDAITVEPGDSGNLTHTFSKTGDVLIGCHQPGHYEAGMRLTVSVGAAGS